MTGNKDRVLVIPHIQILHLVWWIICTIYRRKRPFYGFLTCNWKKRYKPFPNIKFTKFNGKQFAQQKTTVFFCIMNELDNIVQAKRDQCLFPALYGPERFQKHNLCFRSSESWTFPKRKEFHSILHMKCATSSTSTGPISPQKLERRFYNHKHYFCHEIGFWCKRHRVRIPCSSPHSSRDSVPMQVHLLARAGEGWERSLLIFWKTKNKNAITVHRHSRK